MDSGPEPEPSSLKREYSAEPPTTEASSNSPSRPPSELHSASDTDKSDTEEALVSDLLNEESQPDAMEDVDGDLPHILVHEQVSPNQQDLPPAAAQGLEVNANDLSESPKNESKTDIKASILVTSESKHEEVQAMDVDDTGGEDGKDDDASSELSEGGELLEELEDALGDHNFSFDGNFYHSGILTAAPNPCLHISGLGVVGLPLSERDAKAIVSCATLAPFGHGERTVVDKEVRDTWEMEPDRLVFANPVWENYINVTVCSEVCRALGVRVGNSPPKMEMYKLLLYEKGSHFLPHQDTEKANGMFATVVVVLPSAYTGGQVVVSHATTTKTIDYAANSLLSTALLAWYTDVRHEVKPITSGYRLALSYNLIHTAPPGIPRPSLPSMDSSVARLRHILRKWREEKHSTVPEDPPLVAYILNHQYSQNNIGQGVSILKGVDAHRVTFMRDVAKEFGYVVGLANLTHSKSGYAEDDGGRYYRRGRYDDSDEDEDSEDDDPGFAEVESETTSISGLVDLDGTSLLSVGDITLGENSLIPISDPFDDVPDRKEYEGYMGNGAGSLEHWYHRTCLVIMHEDDLDEVCFSVGGIGYAIQKLKQSSLPPTSEDRDWAIRIMGRASSLISDQALVMLDLAMKWNDAEMWSATMKSPACALGVVRQDMLFGAWKQFGWETLRVSFETILARSMDLSGRVKLIYNIKPQASPEEKAVVNAWCDLESDKVLAAYTQPDVRDIPTIMAVIRVVGLVGFGNKMLPNLLKSQNSYTFWIAFIKALREARPGILDSLTKSLEKRAAAAAAIAQEGTVAIEGSGLPAVVEGGEDTIDHTADPSGLIEESSTEAAVAAPTTSDLSGQEAPPTTTYNDTPAEPPVLDAAAFDTIAKTNQLIDGILGQGLKAAASQWSTFPTYSYGFGQTRQQHIATTATKQVKIDRIIEIIEQAFIANDMDVCRTLFVEILRNPGPTNTYDKFSEVYKPLIPRIKVFLDSKNIELTAPPFIDLFQVLIGMYLRDVLGKKGQIMNTKLRKIGCGCPDCSQLDKFMLDPMSSTQQFRFAQKRREHLERRCASATDLCTYVTIRTGSPHGVQVTKLPVVVAASRWETRLADAKAFLKTIGPDVTIIKIMGPRYGDVINALEGLQGFGGAPPAPVQASLPRGAAGVSSTNTALSTMTTNARPTASLQTSAATSSSNTTRPVQPVAPAKTDRPTQHAGQKRKVTPVNIGFIDLSNDSD